MKNFKSPPQPMGQPPMMPHGLPAMQQQQNQLPQQHQNQGMNRMMTSPQMANAKYSANVLASMTSRSQISNIPQGQQNKDPSLTEVSFNVKCDRTRVGDRVALVGNISSLGEWNTDNAIFLETSPESFPVWSTNMALPRDLIIEYKYVIVQFGKMATMKNSATGMYSSSKSYIHSVVWENFGNNTNRRLNTFDKKEIILHEEMSNKKVIEEYVEDKSSSVHLSRGSLKEMEPEPKHPHKDFSPANLHEDPDLSKGLPFNNFISQMPAVNQSMNPSKSNTLIPNVALLGGNHMGGTFSAPQFQLPIAQIQNMSNKGQMNFQNSSKLVNQNQPPLSDQEIKEKQQQAQNAQIQKKKNQLLSGQILEELEEEKSQQSTSRPHLNQDGQRKNTNLNTDMISSTSQNHLIPPSPYKVPMEMFLDDKLQHQIEIDKSEAIILASFLLPYTVERNKKTGELTIHKCFHNPTMLYGTLENMIQKKQFNFKWIGLVTTLEDVSEQEKAELTMSFKQMNAYPIFMTSQELAPYLLFYENIIRPLFHNFKDLYDMRNEYLKYWKDYVDVNKKVADKIIEVKNEHTPAIKTIWIHNCHLLMVPLYVKKLYEEANIGFYFHSPFPSSSHFRINKNRFEILKSLLHCDCIAFHLFTYARNFFKTCHRLLGFELEFLRGGYFGINFHGKNVMIRVSHIGIEESFIQELTLSKKFNAMSIQFQKAMKPIFSMLQSQIQKKSGENFRPLVMSSIDSYHPISGLKNKLLSYKLFLQQYPCYKNKVVLIQFVGSIVQAFDRAESHQGNVDSIKQMRKDVLKIRDEIHQEFGQECFLFEESNPSLEKRLALWSKTDIILCSSLKDGLCIQVLEYVVCRKFANKFRDSCMICSEFAGCNEAMSGVLKYNPFSLDGFVKTMDQAMSLTSDEKKDKMELCYSYIKKNSLSKWTQDFLKDLKLAYKPVDTTYYLGINFDQKSGRNNRLIQIRPDFRRLNIDECSTALLNANKGVIIVEIEALPHLKFSKHSIPTFEVIEQLKGLLIDNRNTVIIVSSEKKEKLMEWFGNGASGNGNHFWIVAESGYLYKPGNKDWQTLTDLDDMTWMPQVKSVMEAYSDNIDGSFVVERQSCIEFNYKNAETEHGTMFVHDIYNLISKIITGTNTEINYGSGYLEVKPQGIKKENLIELLLETISRNSRIIDFIFYLGSDSSAEPVYEILKSKKADDKFFQIDCSKFITVLEKKPTVADFYIEDIEQVMPLLEKFSTKTKQRKKVRSFSDLTKLKQKQGSFGQKKFMAQNKNASIANLDQYINSKLSLNDKLMHISGPTQGYDAFGNKSKGKNKRGGPLSASPQVIEEEKFEDSQGNLPLANNRPKYSSVGDTQAAQRRDENGQQIFPTLDPSGELAYHSNSATHIIEGKAQNQDGTGGAAQDNHLEGGQKSPLSLQEIMNLQYANRGSTDPKIKEHHEIPSGTNTISQGFQGINQHSGNRVDEASGSAFFENNQAEQLYGKSITNGSPDLMRENQVYHGNSFSVPGTGSINGSGLNLNASSAQNQNLAQMLLTRSVTDMMVSQNFQQPNKSQFQPHGLKHAPLSAIGLVHNKNDEQSFQISAGHNSNMIFAQNCGLSPQNIKMGSMGIVPSDFQSNSHSSSMPKSASLSNQGQNLAKVQSSPDKKDLGPLAPMNFMPSVEISSLDQAAKLQELSKNRDQSSSNKFKLDLAQVEKMQHSEEDPYSSTKKSLEPGQKAAGNANNKSIAKTKKQILEDDDDDQDMKFGDDLNSLEEGSP